MKLKTSFSLSEEALQFVELLAQSLGLSNASVLEVAIRKLAKAEGIEISKTKKGKDISKADARR